MRLKPERWKQIERIYYAALEREAYERADFLAQACGSDEELRREVESLLSSHDEAGSFLASPAVDVAARGLADEQAASIVGATIGPYKIISLLGAGGMGEVYLAHDTRLGRRMALKLLPSYFTVDDDRVRRFEREARAASALNHPNILTIYEVGQIEGIHFIATEFVEGKTLRAALASAVMSLREIIEVAMQVASALAAAHQAGIVHRDIKPENIMLRPDGYAKVLDFGLVKLTERGAFSSDSATPTVTAANTDSGVVVGTAHYMSPEQARGLAVDARTDVFSLGIVLYEMIAGRAPFAGETNADVIVAILDKEPAPLARYRQEVPAELERIVRKSLAKNRDDRYQSIRDLVIDLKSLKQEMEFESKLQRKHIEGASPADPRPPVNRVTQAGIASTGAFAKHVSTAEGAVQDQHTEEVLADTLKVKQSSSVDSVIGSAARWKARPALLATGAIVLIAAGLYFYWRSANLRWAREQLPRIEELARQGNFFDAYDLAVEVQKYLPGDATLTRLMPVVSDTLSVATEPAGAQVYLKRFSKEESASSAERKIIGVTPLTNSQIARGHYILSLEKEGYAKAERAFSGYISSEGFPSRPVRVEAALVEAEKVPDRMAYVPGGEYRIVAWRRPSDERVRLDPYLIDRFEVTNQEYKEFINAGGYLKKQFWKYPFLKAGKTLNWEEAMRELKDRTGLAGPRNWSGQNFPEGKAQHPVTDITWYEAAAYAAFRGKQLPTVFQWEKGARNGEATFAGLIMPWGLLGETTDYLANFKGSGTVAVDALEFGMSPYGCYNMAGNVSEWCLNDTSEGFITSGGSWEDPSYLFGYYGTYPGFHSSNKLGFRCVLPLPGAAGDQGAMKIKLEDEVPVYTPASERSVEEWLKHYQYDKAGLDGEVVEVKETDEWRREKITYNGAGGERAIAYLYLPKHFKGPLQVIYFMPAGDVFNRARSLPESIEALLAPLIKSGRAIFSVVFKGFIGRDRPAGYKSPSATTVEFIEDTASFITDARRGLDYLETRGDVDSSRIAYFAPSAGAFKLILPAVEPRYRSVILSGATIRKYYTEWIPAANSINFVPRIRAPKLMIHGRYDEAAPWKTEGEPLYKLLREPKRLYLFEGGHIPGPEIYVPAINAWLDETLGQVKQD